MIFSSIALRTQIDDSSGDGNDSLALQIKYVGSSYSSTDSNTSSSDNNSSSGDSNQSSQSTVIDSELEKITIATSDTLSIYDYDNNSSGFVFDENESYVLNSDNSIAVTTLRNGNTETFTVKYLAIDQNATDEMNSFYSNAYSDIEIHKMYLDDVDGYKFQRVFVSTSESSVLNLINESTHPDFELEGNITQSEYDAMSAQAMSVGFEFYINNDDNSSSSDSNSSYGDSNSSSGDNNTSSGDNNSTSSDSSSSSSSVELEIFKIVMGDSSWTWYEQDSNGTYELDENMSISVDSSNIINESNGSYSIKYLGTTDVSTFNNEFNTTFSSATIYKLAYLLNEDEMDYWDYYPKDYNNNQSNFTSLSEFITYQNSFYSPGENSSQGIAFNGASSIDTNGTLIEKSHNDGSTVNSDAGTWYIENDVLHLNITASGYEENNHLIFRVNNGYVQGGSLRSAGTGGIAYFFDETGKTEFESYVNQNSSSITEEMWFGNDYSDYNSTFQGLSANDPTAFLASGNEYYELGVNINSSSDSNTDNNSNNTTLTTLVNSNSSDYNTTTGIDPRVLTGKSLYYLEYENQDAEAFKVSFSQNDIKWFARNETNSGDDFQSTPFITETAPHLNFNTFELTTSSENIKLLEIVDANTINSDIFSGSTDVKAYKFIWKVNTLRTNSEISNFALSENGIYTIYLFSENAKEEFKNFVDSQDNGNNNSGGSGGSDDSYQNEFSYQVVGTVTLPSLSNDVHGTGMSVQPRAGQDWNFTYIGTTEGNNSYTLGMESGKYVLRFEMHKDSGFEEYIYDANTTNWKPSSEVEYIPVDENGNQLENGDEAYSWIPNVTPIDTTDFNSSNKLSVDFDLASLYGSLFTLEGNVTVSADFNATEYCTNTNSWDGQASSLQVCEWQSNGVSGYNYWVGANRLGLSIQSATTGEHIGWYNLGEGDVSASNGTKTYTFSTKLSSEGNYTIRINKESFNTNTSETSWESYYFNPSTQALIDDKLVNWTQSDQTDNQGNKLWLPDSSQTGYITVAEVNGSKTANFGTIDFVSFESGQIKLNGTISFDGADYIQMELINTSNGNWFGWTQVNNSGDEFNITLPQSEGEYILRVSKVSSNSWESFFYDGNNSKFVQDKNIPWIEVNGYWMPDSNKTGVISIADTGTDGLTQADISNLTLDLTSSAIDSNFYVLEGNVTVESDFEVGDKYDSSGAWIGYNNISFEVLDKDTGEWKGWFEVDRDSNTTDNSGNRVYSYKLVFDSADEYIVQVRYERNSEGYNEYKGYFINFQNNTLVSDRTVKYKELGTSSEGYAIWGPDSNETGWLTLSDSTRKVTRNIDFVTLANNVYKLSGIVTVPTGFTPNFNWGDSRGVIRIEAINGDTGEWIADGHISDQVVDGTTDQYRYSFELPGVMQNDNIIVKLIIEDGYEWDAYYIDFGTDNNDTQNISLVSEGSVSYVETNTTDDNGNPIWKPDAPIFNLSDNKAPDLPIPIPTLIDAIVVYKFTGKVVLTQSITLGQTGSYYNSVSLEAINKSTGQWVAHMDVDYKTDTSDEFTFDLEVPSAGDYIIKVNLNIDGKWEDYYINFGNNNTGLTDSNATTYTLVPGHKVQWQDINGTWMPDPSKTGHLALSGKLENYTVDISSYENSIKKLSGTITVADDFTVGDKFDSSGNWIGYTSLRVEAISKSTGEFISSAEMVSKATNSDYYPYELKIGDTDEVGTDFIIRISKNIYYDGSWDGQEYYINFGDNHSFDYSDNLVNGKRVQWVEASEYISGRTWKQWMPNPDSTGWVTFGSSSIEGVNVDLTTLGQNDVKINGTVTGLPSDTDEARVGVIDASTGMWVADASVNLSDGNFSVNLGDASEAAGNYVLQLVYEHRDFTNWANSWWRNKYIDFGSDNALGGGDDSILSDSEITWNYSSSTNSWIPSVNYLAVDTTTIDGLTIDLSTVQGVTINGTISDIPSGAMYAYAWVSNTSNYSGVWSELTAQNDGTYTFSAEELKADTNYTVEFGYESNGKFYNYFIKDSDSDLTNGVSSVAGNEVRWENSGNNIWNPSSEDTTYVSISTDLNLSISIPTVVLNTVAITLNGTGDGEYISADMNIPGKPFGRWAQATSSGTSALFTFDDVKNGSEYIVSFWYAGNQYTCDGASCGSLVKNAQWYGYDSSGNQVCPTASGSWECNWDNSYNWTWKPSGITALSVSGDMNISVSLPEEKTVSGNIDLSTTYANKTGFFSVYKDGNYNGREFTLDGNGDANLSLKIEDGTAYRIELWIDGLGAYVYTTSNTWIDNYNSWDTTTWQPKAETLIDINANVGLGTIDLTSGKSTVTFVLENLYQENGANAEDVWLSLESSTLGFFGEGNANWQISPVTYDSNITIVVPDGDYNLSVYPSHHVAGFASDADTTGGESVTTFTKFNWQSSERDLVSVSGDTTITITLPDLASFGSISGAVDCDGDSNSSTSNCGGWIEATGSSVNIGSVVETNGSYEINGLEAGTYELNYNSWNLNSAVFIVQENVSVTADNITTVNLAPASGADVLDINGTVASSDYTDMEVVLIKVDSNSFEIIDESDVNSTSGAFSFGSKPKPGANKAYYVAVAKKVVNQTTFALTTNYDEITVVSDDDSVGTSAITLPSADLATGITLN